MSDTLATALEHLGYGERREQRKLYESLRGDGVNVIAQAGTGVGKSIAILSAAYDDAQAADMPSLVVVPTNVLMDQYAKKDGPAFSAATGAVVETLKGRSHYLCADGDGWFFSSSPPPELEAALNPDGEEIYEVTSEQAAFGCPGSEGCSGTICHYRRARARLAGADIIVTNAHIYHIESSFEAIRQHEDCDRDASCTCGPRILPEFCSVFVDEAHTLEDIVRDFTGVTIALRTLRGMDAEGLPLARWLRTFRGAKDERIAPNATLRDALAALSRWTPPDGNPVGHARRLGAVAAAKKLLAIGAAGGFSGSSSVLWVEPGEHAKLHGKAVFVGGTIGAMLKRKPFALVSATVPQTMAANLGVQGTEFVDVGHPFDYARQGRIELSRYPGDYRSNLSNLPLRAGELADRIVATGGGALLLFSSYANLEKVYDVVAPRLRQAGITVMRQERESNKRELGERFKADGNAVLFGTKSFATGFDAPGDALRLVGIWNLPYPGNSPLVEAIRSRSWSAYEDMMLVDFTQAVGRLIRTTSDTGDVYIADSRAERIFQRTDPMLSHLREFQRA